MGAFTTNKMFKAPTVAGDNGIWGNAFTASATDPTGLNGDISMLDGVLGGVLQIGTNTGTVGYSGAQIADPGSPTPGAGPTLGGSIGSAYNAVIRATAGTLAGNLVIQIRIPGFYILHNAVGNQNGFTVAVNTGFGGRQLGLPPGKMQHAFCDGTNWDFVNMPDPGTYWDVAGSVTPLWIGACTNAPWLLCNGAAYNATANAFLQPLFNQIGTAYGGTGQANFNVPDLCNRVRASGQMGGTQRLSTGLGTSGINGAVIGSAGGNEQSEQHNHNYTEPNASQGHKHATYDGLGVGGTGLAGITPSGAGSPGGGIPVLRSDQTNTALNTLNTGFQTTGISISNTFNAVGSGNAQPTIVAGLTFIKT